MAEATSNNLELWRARLNASGLPVFARTVRDVSHVATSRMTSASDLSNVIGQDAAMAVRILQIANSSLFNLQNRNIETISEAVVLVGFNAVRELAISVSVIEELLKGDQHGQLGSIMARAFHAAAQAKFLAEKQEVNGTEEVFVAALLKQVGEMAFWSRAEREAQRLEAQLRQGVPARQAQQSVLGFELDELGSLLAEDWSLGTLLTSVLDGKHGDLPNVASVSQGHEVAEVLETHDWESPQVLALVQQVSDQLSMKSDDVRAALHDNLQGAAEMVAHFGIKMTPLPAAEASNSSAASHVPGLDEQAGPLPVNAPVDAPPVEMTYSATALLTVLQRIASDLEDGAGRDELMQQVVDGAADALALVDVHFALFSPDRQQLVVKYVADGAKAARMGEQIVLADLPVDVLDSAAAKVLVHAGRRLIVSVRLKQKPIGVLFATSAGGEMNDEQLQGFRQFAQQIGLILTQTM